VKTAQNWKKFLLKYDVIKSYEEWYKGTGKVLISTVQNCDGDIVSKRTRASVLSHESSHLIYLTDKGYRNIVDSFWKNELNAADRKFTKFVVSYMRGDLGGELK